MPKPSKRVYQVKVTLRGTKPPIWRRLLVSTETPLSKLHGILQISMGWTDSHLHGFESGGTVYGVNDPDLDFGIEVRDERTVRLEQLLRKVGDRLHYEYDFGDGWYHEVRLERIGAPEEGQRYPWVVTGKRACPPEDCGGLSGFYGFIEAVTSPSHPEHEELLEWYGGPFDPEAFDAEEVNQILHGPRGAGARW